MNIGAIFWHNLVCMNLPKNVGASAHARAELAKATWRQPPSAVQSSEARQRLWPQPFAELRSAGQPGAAAPTQSVRLHWGLLFLLLSVLALHTTPQAQGAAVVTFTLDFPGS